MSSNINILLPDTEALGLDKISNIISVSNMLDKSSTLPSLLRSINDFESAVIVPHITFFATCAPFEYNIGYNARLMRNDIAEHDDTPFKLIYIGCSSILSSARGSTCHLSANCLMKKFYRSPIYL